MLYLCEWSGGYIIFDDVTKRLATSAKLDKIGSIHSYYEGSWNTTKQAHRKIQIVDNYLTDSGAKHKVILTIPTQATTLEEFEQQHPEFLI